jgi:hypothetical protein
MDTARNALVRYGTRAALAAFLFAGATSGCSRVIGLNPDRYLPQFDPAPLANYRGAALVMRGFENADDNTTIFYYPRSGPRMYGGPVLTSYFWYCFRTAFESLGVRVFDNGYAAADLPIMELRMIRLDENGYTVDVRVVAAGLQPVLHKRYSVAGPPLASLDLQALEARAYQMTTAVFLSIVNDPEFQAIVASGGRSGAFVGSAVRGGAAPGGFASARTRPQPPK